jgi:FKBP-type peptidyl-prolyl cis-trans isomerase
MIPGKTGYGAQGSPQKIPGMANNLFSCLLVLYDAD